MGKILQKKSIPYFVFGILMLFVMIIFISQAVDVKNSITKQTEKIADLKNDIVIAKSDNQIKQDNIVMDSTGYNGSRVVKDKSIAKDFIKECMSWETYDEYNKARNEIKTKYRLKNDNFLNVFMPEVVNTTSPDGTEYNRIDTLGYNMSFENMDVYVSDISENGTYSYFSFVDITSRDNSGNEGEGKSLFVYDIDKNGIMSNIDAYTIS